MIHFTDLKFVLCVNHIDGNSLAQLILENGYQFDIIKKPKTKTYKVKPFEMIGEKKRYVADLFPEYGFPEFAGRDALVDWLNIVDKHNLSETPNDLEEQAEEEV